MQVYEKKLPMSLNIAKCPIGVGEEQVTSVWEPPSWDNVEHVINQNGFWVRDKSISTSLGLCPLQVFHKALDTSLSHLALDSMQTLMECLWGHLVGPPWDSRECSQNMSTSSTRCWYFKTGSPDVPKRPSLGHCCLFFFIIHSPVSKHRHCSDKEREMESLDLCNLPNHGHTARERWNQTLDSRSLDYMSPYFLSMESLKEEWPCS